MISWVKRSLAKDVQMFIYFSFKAGIFISLYSILIHPCDLYRKYEDRKITQLTDHTPVTSSPNTLLGYSSVLSFPNTILSFSPFPSCTERLSSSRPEGLMGAPCIVLSEIWEMTSASCSECCLSIGEPGITEEQMDGWIVERWEKKVSMTESCIIG